MPPSPPSKDDDAVDRSLREFHESAIGKSVGGRAKVRELASIDRSAALNVARSIEHPWYRCQALASIVELNASDPESEALLTEALAAAYSQSEPNRIASVAFWPLRILASANADVALIHTERLLAIIANEPHGLRRLDGLRAILMAVISLEKLRNLALPMFLNAAKESEGWRTERNIDLIAPLLAEFDRDAAIRLLLSRPATRFTRRSRSMLLGINAPPKA